MSAELERLTNARRKVAELLLGDPVYAPVFARLEAEIAAHESTNDLVERARSIVRLHKATA